MKNNLFAITFLMILMMGSSCSSRSESTYEQNSGESTYEEDTENEMGSTYDYSVSGNDESGNQVKGEVEVTQDGGSGTITDEYGEEKYVDVEWTGNGELEGTDDEGNTYELETD